MPSEYSLCVREAVNAVDPVGLVALDCPEDEHDPEVADIVRLNERVNPDEILDVFVRWFGDDGRMERRQAEAIAPGQGRERAGRSGQASGRLQRG